MPYNGSGSFARLYSWVADKANGIFIDSTRSDNELNGIATGLSNVICKDGQTTLTADIPWNGKKITGYGTTNTPSARSDVPQVGQVQDAKFNWVVAGGTADAITASYAPPITALVDGQECKFRASAANATATPTFSPSGLTAHTITKNGGAALAPGDIPAALAEIPLRYNLANTRWELLRSPSTAPVVQVFKANGTYTPTAGMTSCQIMAKGGGGGGGGSTVTGYGGGGGEGEIACRMATAAQVGASIAISIGAGGGSVALNTNAIGGTGNTTSAGGLALAAGGVGGFAGNSGGAGGAGGNGGGAGDYSEPGAVGQTGSDSTGAGAAINSAGGGKGAGAFGGAGRANSGGGGGGGSTALASGAGGSGIVVITEFFNR